MSVTFVDPSEEGSISLPPDPDVDGVQYADGGLVIQQGALVVLDPLLYALASKYTLFNYGGSFLKLLSADGVELPLTTPNLRLCLELDDTELRASRSLKVGGEGLVLNGPANIITVTLVPA